MTTIGRNYVGKPREYATACDICGVMYHRSDLRRNANGHLACPDDIEGRVERELDRANARGVAAARIGPGGVRR